jgi:hypothetical protein
MGRKEGVRGSEMRTGRRIGKKKRRRRRRRRRRKVERSRISIGSEVYDRVYDDGIDPDCWHAEDSVMS